MSRYEDQMSTKEYWAQRDAARQADIKAAHEYAQTPYGRLEALDREANALRAMDLDSGTDSSARLAEIAAEIARVNTEIAASKPARIEWALEETQANRETWNSYIRAQGKFAPRDTAKIQRAAEAKLGFDVSTLREQIKRYGL
jgi:hypothetical protein